MAGKIIFSGGGFVGESHPRGMIIKPTAEGLADAQEAWERIEAREVAPDAALYDLLEYWSGNGWTWISPEAIGALTDAPIMSPDAAIEDDGTTTVYPGGAVYWHSNYMVEDPVEKWAQGDGVVWDVSRAENPRSYWEPKGSRGHRRSRKEIEGGEEEILRGTRVTTPHGVGTVFKVGDKISVRFVGATPNDVSFRHYLVGEVSRLTNPRRNNPGNTSDLVGRLKF